MSIPVSQKTVSRVTTEQFAAMPDDDRLRELVDGDVRVVSPAGNEPGGWRSNWLCAQEDSSPNTGSEPLLPWKPDS